MELKREVVADLPPPNRHNNPAVAWCHKVSSPWSFPSSQRPHLAVCRHSTSSLLYQPGRHTKSLSHCRPTPVTPVTTGVPICLHCRVTDCTLTAQPISHKVGGATLQCNLICDATFCRLFMHEVLSRRRRSQVAETGAIMSSEWF